MLALADKTSHRILWAYDVEREDLLVSFEIVNLAFDIAARAPDEHPGQHPRRRDHDVAPRISRREAPSGACSSASCPLDRGEVAVADHGIRRVDERGRAFRLTELARCRGPVEP